MKGKARTKKPTGRTKRATSQGEPRTSSRKTSSARTALLLDLGTQTYELISTGALPTPYRLRSIAEELKKLDGGELD